MNKGNSRDRVVVASDVSDRDGIGIEFYRNDVLVVEVFRDDAQKTREVTLYKKNVSLDLVEEAIVSFRNEIPWEFQD